MTIAVLLAIYNGEKFIREQLDSLLEQSFGDFICYIHDDGSTDGSEAVIAEYAAAHPEKFRILDYPGTGAAQKNFLSMLSRVDADYILFCDHDDIWLPEKIQKTYELMKKTEKSGRPCAVFSDLRVVNGELETIAPSYLRFMGKDPQKTSVNELIVNNTAAGCTMMINRVLAKLMTEYEDIDNIFMHDWWGMLIAACYGEIAYLDGQYILYRQHGKNQVGASKNIFRWLGAKLSNVMNARQIKESKAGILYQRGFAKELVHIGKENSLDVPELIAELAVIESCSKSERIRFYRKNRLLRQDMKNRWKIILV